MSDVPPPPTAPVPPAGPGAASPPPIMDDVARGWSTALARGLIAFVVMAGLGQAAAFLVYFVSDQTGSVGTFAKLGWFYFDSFHHIALSASVPNISIPDTGGVLAGGASIRAHLGLALMLGTFLAIWLLYGAGKAVADRAEGGGVARVLHGLKVAPVYALPCLLFSLLVKVKVTIPPGAFASGSVEVKSSAAQSFLIPLLIAAAAGAAGGLRSGRYEFLSRGPWGRRVSGALAGGLRMLTLGIVLSFVGLLVLGVVHPDATKAYFRTVSEPPVDETVLIIGHHVLVLPNQSMWVLVPAMGGCDGVYGSGGSRTFLCYWKYPRQVSVSTSGGPQGSVLSGLPQVRTEFGTAPTGYFLFLLVPAISPEAGQLQVRGRRGGGGGRRCLRRPGGGGVLVRFAVRRRVGQHRRRLLELLGEDRARCGDRGTHRPRVGHRRRRRRRMVGGAGAPGTRSAPGALRPGGHPGPA